MVSLEAATQANTHRARDPVKLHSHLYYIQNSQSIALFGELAILIAPESDFPETDAVPRFEVVRVPTSSFVIASLEVQCGQFTA